MNLSIPEEIKFLTRPLVYLSITFVLVVVIMSVGLKQVRNIIVKAQSAKETQLALKKKADSLERVAEIIPEDINFLDIVLPDKLSILYGLSQIKNEAARNSLYLTNIKTGSLESASKELSKTSISFDAEGDQTSIYNFVSSFSTILPIMNIQKLRIVQTASSARLSATVYVYSAELPKTIPSLTSTVNNLSDEEISLLKNLSQYTLPIFVEAGTGEKPAAIREDPFN